MPLLNVIGPSVDTITKPTIFFPKVVPIIDSKTTEYTNHRKPENTPIKSSSGSSCKKNMHNVVGKKINNKSNKHAAARFNVCILNSWLCSNRSYPVGISIPNRI